MQPRQPTLNELLRKTAGGHDLTLNENIIVKKSYQDLRRHAQEILGDFTDEALMRSAATSGDQDFRAFGILWTLRQFEAEKMTLEAAHREMLSIFRHPHDSRLRAPTLRADIAFYLAVSTLLLRSQRVTRNRTMDLCVVLEMLAHLSRLDQAVHEYERYQKSRAKRTRLPAVSSDGSAPAALHSAA